MSITSRNTLEVPHQSETNSSEGLADEENKAESAGDDTQPTLKPGQVEVVPAVHPSRQARYAEPPNLENLRGYSAQIRSIDVKKYVLIQKTMCRLTILSLPSTITDLFEGSNPDVLSDVAASCSIDRVLKAIGIETLTSIQYAVLRTYFDNKAEQQKWKEGKTAMNAIFLTVPDMTIIAGYGKWFTQC